MARKKKGSGGSKGGNAAASAAPTQPKEAANASSAGPSAVPGGSAAAACAAVLERLNKNAISRAEACNSFRTLAGLHPTSELPHRYLARMLYHEAACEPADSSGPRAGGGESRLAVLKQALQEAAAATEAAPLSLSCAALRATLVVNLLVENGKMLPNQSGGSLEAAVADMRAQLRSGVAAAERALAAAGPGGGGAPREPLITISTGDMQTTDPCCQNVADRVNSLVASGAWGEVACEKAAALQGMSTTLTAYSQLLESAAPPPNGTARMLSQAMRGGTPDTSGLAQQLLATMTAAVRAPSSQLAGMLPGAASGGQLSAAERRRDLARRMETQSHAAWLLQKMDSAAAASSAAAVASGAPSAGPAGQLTGSSQPLPPLSPASLYRSHMTPSQVRQMEMQQQQDSLAGSELSITRSWDVVAREAAANARKRPGRGGRGGGRPERPPQQRYESVKAHWASLSSERRRRLLTVPVKRLARVTRAELGPEAAAEVAHALRLLQERGDRHAAFWACPPCDAAFPSSVEFNEHLYAYHEEAVYADEASGRYLICSHCSQEIVGAYYRSPTAAGFQLCTRCNAAAGNSAGKSSPKLKALSSGTSSARVKGKDDPAAGPLVCVEHRAPVLPAPWEDALPRGLGAPGDDMRHAVDGSDDYHLRLGQLQDALASLCPPGEAGIASAVSTTGWGGAAGTFSAAATRPRTGKSAKAAEGDERGSSSQQQSTSRSGGAQGDDESGPAFAFGQLTSSLPEPLTFGGSPASDGPSARGSKVTSPVRARGTSPGAPAASSPARAGHPHKRAREDDLMGASGQLPSPGLPQRPGLGSVLGGPDRTLQERGRATAAGSRHSEQLGGGKGSAPPRLATALSDAASGGGGASGQQRGSSAPPDSAGRQCLVESASDDGSVDSDGGSEGGSQRERESGTWRNVLQDNPLARRIKEWQQGKLPFGVSFGGNGSPHAGAQPGSDGRGGRGAPGPADSVQSLELSRSSAEQMPDDGRDKRGGSAALQAKQHAAHQKLVFQQQQALVQQQLQRIVGGDALAAHQLSLDVSAERMNDMLTNHFTRHSLDNKAMVSMVMAEVQNMANMDQDLFRSRFVNVICRIQGLLLQSRESAASQEHQLQVQQASDGPASDAASDGQSSSVERGHRAVDDFLALEPDEVWTHLERRGVADLQEVLSHLPRHLLEQLLKELIVAMHTLGGPFPAEGGAFEAAGSEDECIGCFSLFQFSQNTDAARLEAALAAADTASSRGGGRGGGSGSEGSSDAGSDDVVLEVNTWWLEHLTNAGGEGRHSEEQLQVLRWIYGGLVCTQNLEFLERQAEVLPGGSAPHARSAAVGALLDDLSAAWRRYQHTMDCKRKAAHLSGLAKQHFMAVRQMEEAGTSEPLRRAAAAYRDAYVAAHDAQGVAGPAAQQRADALRAQLQQFSILSSDDAFRYAAELVQREEAALGLVKEMLGYEGREAAREAAAAEQRLAAARLEAAEVDADLARAQAEGPASHRKRDYIDKATKEAEHRDRLADLRGRGDSARDRATSEQDAILTSRLRREQADKDLVGVSSALARQVEMADKLAEALARPGTAGSAPPQDAVVQMYIARLDLAEIIIEYGGSFEAGAGTLRLYVHAVALARQAADAAQSTMEKEFRAIDELKERLQLAACVDMSVELSEAALSFIRSGVEAAAARAQDAATAHLLAELEAEEAAAERKAGEKAKRKKSKAARRKAVDSASEVSPPELSCAGARPDTESEADAQSESPSQAPSDPPEAAAKAAKHAGEPQASKLSQQSSARSSPAPPQQQDASSTSTASAAESSEPLTKAQKRAERQKARQAAAAAESACAAAGPSAVTGAAAAAATSDAAAAESVVEALPPAPPAISAHQAAIEEAEDADLRRAIEASLADMDSASAPPKSPSRSSVKAAGKALVKGAVPVSPVKGNKSAAEWQAVGLAASPAAAKTRRRKKGKDKDEVEVVAATMTAAPQPAVSSMRIVSYFGHWLCHCGKESALWDKCVCGQVGPCRDWVRGRCQYGAKCHFTHLPFDLPATPPQGDPIAKPAPDAPRWRAGVGAVMPPTAAAAKLSKASVSTATKVGKAVDTVAPAPAPTAAAKPAASAKPAWEVPQPQPSAWTQRPPAIAGAAPPAASSGPTSQAASTTAFPPPSATVAVPQRPQSASSSSPAAPVTAPPSVPASPSVPPSLLAPPAAPASVASDPPQPLASTEMKPLPAPERQPSGSAPLSVPLGVFGHAHSGSLPPLQPQQAQRQASQTLPPLPASQGPAASDNLQQQAHSQPQTQQGLGFGGGSYSAFGDTASRQAAANGTLWGSAGWGGSGGVSTSVATPSSLEAAGSTSAFNPFGDNPLLRAFAADRRLDTAPSLGASTPVAPEPRPASVDVGAGAADSGDMIDADGLGNSIMSMLQLGEAEPSRPVTGDARSQTHSRTASTSASRGVTPPPHSSAGSFSAGASAFGAVGGGFGVPGGAFGAGSAFVSGPPVRPQPGGQYGGGGLGGLPGYSPRMPPQQQPQYSGLQPQQQQRPGALPHATSASTLQAGAAPFMGPGSRPGSAAPGIGNGGWNSMQGPVLAAAGQYGMNGGSGYGGINGGLGGLGGLSAPGLQGLASQWGGLPGPSPPSMPQQPQLQQGLGNGRLTSGGGSFGSAGGSGNLGALRGSLHHVNSGQLSGSNVGAAGMQRAYSLSSQLPPQQQVQQQPQQVVSQVRSGGAPCGGDDGSQLVGCMAVALWALPSIRSAVMDLQSVGAAQGAKPTAVAAAALRTVFASLSQQAARGGAAALAGVPDHVRDTLWRDFATAGLVQEVQGAGAAAALEGTLSGLDRGLWAAGGPAGTLMGAVGLALDDVVRCRQCDRTSTVGKQYSWWALTVAAAALVVGPSLEAALASAPGASTRPCPQVGCGAAAAAHPTVRTPPRALVVTLAWGAAPPSDRDMGAVLSMLPPRLTARGAFPGASHGGSAPAAYRLAAALVGRVGSGAYATLVADPGGGGVWAAAGPPGFNAGASLGDWGRALGQCRAARMAPLLLLYAQAN
eukprot:CAMPEP_0206142900 /NCGR_PEP_ID=MMETSP1473-20131121/18579_1 /ASSEMBLY_ACC=CAM_ASM_001109 /TAXON_ID=1461547 /ORGANISM="Stichococcus sp, Strain RCC1054" /LENGTH=3025 /DNA_ID=CAMNT_0053538067 /DNA_START=97 /DNA_END=9174 /DNA_ORIENTATION=+